VDPYLLIGTVRPERAALDVQDTFEFAHFALATRGLARVRIVKNQIAVWVETEHAYAVNDLRNLVQNMVQDLLAAVTYVHGSSYEVEITRVICTERGVDYVFGVDTPCIAARVPPDAQNVRALAIRARTAGAEGIYVSRAMVDLSLALKHANDTGFYCYRAIESLRQHCAAVNGLGTDESGRAEAWAKFRATAACGEAAIGFIASAAKVVRHGGLAFLTDADRAALLTKTWDIVDGYLAGIATDPGVEPAKTQKEG